MIPRIGSLSDQLARSILNDLQQTDEAATSSPTDSSSLPQMVVACYPIDGLTNVIANNLLAKYLQAWDSSLALSSASPSTQVNAIA